MAESWDAPVPEVFRAIAESTPGVDISAVATCNVMRLVFHAVRAAANAHFARHGLSRGRFAILMMLMGNSEEGATPAQLADHACVTRASATGLLNGLVQAELVERGQHPNDRRMIIVRITPKGREMLQGMLPDHFRRLTGLMSGLNPEERRTFAELMKKIAEGIPEMRDP